MKHPVDELKAAVAAAAAELRTGGDTPKGNATLERPRQAGFGDYATNAALLLAATLKARPRDIAERLGVLIGERLGDKVAKVEVAGPGFLNLFLADAWFVEATRTMLAAPDWGAGSPEIRHRFNVEFVSANPTGPPTAASGRHAAYGDALCRILAFAGHDVSSEYYLNDEGSQVDRLGASVRARARGAQPPEDGYQGDYVTEMAQTIPNAAELSDREAGAQATAIVLEMIRATLHAYRVDFDTWFFERSLHTGDPSAIGRAFDRARELGRLYEHDGATWLRTSDLGDDKDRVLLRQTGAPTYFAADLAYLEDKVSRGFDRLVYVLGADHHGYIGRLQAAAKALGLPDGTMEIPILQFVHVVEGGQKARMSKRRGDFVTLDELIAEIGVDATRFFMLQRSQDSTIDLDLDLAKAESSENPVYYVQYAHARIASVLRRAGEEKVAAAVARPPDASHALEPAERELVNKLLAFGAEVQEAAAKRAPHRIAGYALETAQAFTAFYRDCRIVGAEPEATEAYRIALSVAAQRTLARALGLLGVSAPDEM